MVMDWMMDFVGAQKRNQRYVERKPGRFATSKDRKQGSSKSLVWKKCTKRRDLFWRAKWDFCQKKILQDYFLRTP